MKLLSYFLLALFSLSYSGQNIKSKNLNCSILVDIDYKGFIDIFDSEDLKKVIKKVKHNFEEEDYLYFDILKSSDSAYYVVANYSINGQIIKGWIKKKQSILGIYSRAYTKDFNLYEMPNKSSKIVSVVKKYSPKLYRVIDCQDNWLLVSVKIDIYEFKGWMSPEMQCSNQYSTCN